MGVVRVAVFLDGEDGNVVDGIGLVAQIHHVFHPDARHEPVLHEEADAGREGILGLVGIVVVMLCQKLAVFLLHTVDKIHAVGSHHLRFRAAHVDAPGGGDPIGADALQQGDDVSGGKALILNAAVAQAEAVGIRVAHGMDDIAVVPLGHALPALEVEGGAEGVVPLLLAQGQELFCLRPFKDEGKVRLRPLGVLLGGGGRKLPCVPAGIPPEDAQYHKAKKEGDAEPLPGETAALLERLRGGGFRWGGGFLWRGGELRHGDAELPTEGQEIFHVRGGDVRLPFADGLAADAKPCAQLLLGDAEPFPVFTDPLA